MHTHALEDTEVCQMPQVSTPAITVVIPTYNRSASIKTAIYSVLAQTYADFELIVVDDGSSDETMAVVQALEDPRIGVLRHKINKGPSHARNTGTLAASAPLVAFQDSDDIWLPDKLALQVACLKDPAVVASYCGMIVTGSLPGVTSVLRLAPEGSYASGDILLALLRRSLISTQTLVARRQALVDVGLFDPAFRALEDWDLALRLAQAGNIVPADTPLVVQRFSDNSLTREAHNWALAHRDILIKHADLLARHPQAGALQWSIVAGRMRAVGEAAQSRAAALMAMRLNGPKFKPILQYLAAVVKR